MGAIKKAKKSEGSKGQGSAGAAAGDAGKAPVLASSKTGGARKAGASVGTSAEQHFEAWRSAARKLAAHEVRAFKADVLLAQTNVRRGVVAVQERAPELKGRFSDEEIARIEKLPELALGLVFAAARVEALQVSSDGSLAAKLERARELRRILLRGAEACAEAKLVPSSEVTRIREGRGAIDTAQDCILLATFYRQHASAVQGRTPATEPLLDEAARLGTELVELLKPGKARPVEKSSKALDEATDLRDRFWSLLWLEHELLWKMGAMLWGKAVDEHVPPLQSRVVANPDPTRPSGG